MNWIPVLVIVVLFVAMLVMKKSAEISAEGAREHLKSGALVIDVRTPGEFKSGHLPNAINIPLDEIETVVPKRVKDKSQVLLLHCASGMRSSVAQKKLAGMGYDRASNLGSFTRARKIVGDAAVN